MNRYYKSSDILNKNSLVISQGCSQKNCIGEAHMTALLEVTVLLELLESGMCPGLREWWLHKGF